MGRRAVQVEFVVVLRVHEVIQLSVQSMDDQANKREEKRVVSGPSGHPL